MKHVLMLSLTIFALLTAGESRADDCTSPEAKEAATVEYFTGGQWTAQAIYQPSTTNVQIRFWPNSGEYAGQNCMATVSVSDSCEVSNVGTPAMVNGEVIKLDPTCWEPSRGQG